MTVDSLLPIDRFLETLKIVQKEGQHLSFSWHRLFADEITAQWVKDLEQNPELAERLEAFVSRFGRMQDTIADKLLPRLLLAQAENPGSQIEVLNRAERLNVLDSVENWLMARKLRNRLVHEYMDSPEGFSDDLNLARKFCSMFISTYNQIRDFANLRMSLSNERLPLRLNELAQS
jgi:hypothetical protein